MIIYAYDSSLTTINKSSQSLGNAWDGSAFDYVWSKLDLPGVAMRGVAYGSSATKVPFRSIKSFADGIHRASYGKAIKELLIMDHGYLIEGQTYKSAKTKQTHNQVSIEFGSEAITNSNFVQYQHMLGRCRFSSYGARAIFLNCFVGNDPALLLKFAKVWGCPVTGIKQDFTGMPILNWARSSVGSIDWVTVHPSGSYRESKVNPLLN